MRAPFASLRALLSAPVSGFDAWRLVAQIAVLQTLHYFVLLLLLPLAHLLVATPAPLGFTGGALSVSRLLDWRELVAARQFVASPTWADVWLAPVPLAGVAGTGPLQHVPVRLVARPGPEQGVAAPQTLLGGDAPGDEWAVRGADARRKWAAWLAWSVAGVVDVHLLLFFIRRPTQMLDHVLTLHVLHLLASILYTRAFPGLSYFALAAVHAAAVVLVAERRAVRREMHDGFEPLQLDDDEEAPGAAATAHSAPRRTDEVFKLEDEDDDDDAGRTKEEIEMRPLQP